MFIGVFLVSSAAIADFVVGTGSNTWQPYPADVQQNNHPYWDGNSSDYGTAGTVGNYLTKTGAFSSTGHRERQLPAGFRAANQSELR